MRTVVFFDPYPVVGLGFTQILKANRTGIHSAAVSCDDTLAELAKEVTPDMLVLTVNSIKNKNPLLALEQCRKVYPDTPVVLYDEGHYKSHMVKWMKAGVVGYLLKSEPGAVLLQCIDTVLSGRKYLSPEGWGIYFSSKQPVKRADLGKPGKREAGNVALRI
jgi:DNA-binding NarL/FixJ family response regulator